MKQLLRSLFIVVLSSTISFADPTFRLRELQFTSIFGQRAGDSTAYSLLGTGFFRTIRTDDADQIIKAWIVNHPDADVIPVDTALWNGNGSMDYIWIESGEDILNLILVRDGVFPGGVMADRVDYLSSLPDSLRPNKTGKDFPRRLVTDDQYSAFMRRVVDAEQVARTEHKGIWSDQYKELREEEGVE